MSDIGDIKARVKKLSARATQAEMDPHDLFMSCP